MNKKIAAVLILVIVIIVLFVFSLQSKKTSTQEAKPTPAVSSLEVKNFSIVLNPQNNSGESGIVLFEKVDDKTLVKINLVGFQPGIVQPAHFHGGTCGKPALVRYDIENVVNGKSETLMDVKLEDLLKDLPLVVNVHKSIDEEDIFTSCGEVLPL